MFKNAYFFCKVDQDLQATFKCFITNKKRIKKKTLPNKQKNNKKENKVKLLAPTPLPFHF